MMKIYFDIDNYHFIRRHSAAIINQKATILSSNLMSLVIVYLHAEEALGMRCIDFLIKRLLRYHVFIIKIFYLPLIKKIELFNQLSTG